MSPVWVVSSVLAWLVIVLLVVAVVRLLRMLGALQADLSGEAPVAAVELYDEVAGYDEPTLVVVHQPGCAGCDAIPEALAALAGDPRTAVRVVSVTDPATLPVALRPRTVPAAVGLNDGVVVALGRPRTAAQLREAAVATAGADLAAPPGSRRQTGWGVSAPFYGME